MLKPFPLTVTLTLTLLTLITGCSSQSNSSQPASNTTETTTLPKVVKKPDLPQIASADNPDSAMQQKITQYINSIAAKGFSKQSQGIWMQSGNTLLANHQGTIPLPAASLTKVATSLAALKTFNPDYQFITNISSTGEIKDGILEGDLVIEGGEDPFFVWEEAFAIGNMLNQMGIKQVKGNLIIIGKFYMNFDTNPLKSGNLLKQGLNAQNWPPAALTQYQTLPPETPKPQIAIAGSVKVTPTPPNNLKPLIRHYSFPLAELLKKMNQYSNNQMAEIIANSVGGAKAVAQKAAAAANFPQTEISLVNGSGLSEENKISPRAVCAMFLAIEEYLQDYNMTVGDLFAIVGQDEGILNERKIPPLAVVKSGSLNAVSALAGALPTQNQGIVWFVTMNGGANLEGFRTQQEILLQDFIAQWGSVQTLPKELQPNPQRQNKTSRNEIVN
ncbi:MAG TPA: D-alanyl-D-alanine carboxypeptidase [Cyanobacteria bacterium UBA11149]|nr:D-alanyl-D-alanine carboxypeptidase [Cyanobacteria bacterium UBA11367]HBE58677.1 D-alanyl-D-alanine carboxypeptidase [Cyanobacteria bacterium UBA11366]HBK65759.1 D-alanyl-D-alanine carboxypeptidase [Cyanobacteria bacterium UBA11166]HBR77164.1 D-alanyl-D-alanine carboxypeptidase [Cyanobacteria bacterium UBA11159]HBS69040.1 D-alanyl-D-alanine carboxypeptidase [Cyanobacteria bacterium UBA11153]HBW88926.1 D-alanyl-D-alanine carboxypeptidase [Cyanobacteria bacterium UBA11149]HCA97136.1 D-alanyl